MAAALALLFLLLMSYEIAAAYATPAMGFHEGSRRTIQCDGSYITGFDVYMGRVMGFTEPTVVAVRVKCSNGKLKVDFEGTVPDTQVFGNLEANSPSPQAVDCPAGTGVAAVQWRRANLADKDNTVRVGGLRVRCGSESSSEAIAVDAAGSATYPFILRCSDTEQPPKGASVRATSLELWFEQLFAGLHLKKCEAVQ